VSATEAPTPVAEPTSALDVALAWSNEFARAVSEAPAVVRVAEAPEFSRAAVCSVMMLMARAPAMPTEVALPTPA